METHLLGTLIGWYREPLFWLFPMGIFVASVLGFLLFALPLSLLAWWDPGPLRRWRIQPARPSAEGVFWPSVRSWLRGLATLVAASVVTWPVLRLFGVHAGPLDPWWWMALQIVAFVLIDDALYYWQHRWMHRWTWLYERVHAHHHQVSAPWAAVGNHVHPVEFIVVAAIFVSGPLLLGAHVVTIWIWSLIRQWQVAEQHCGYDFPLWPGRLIPLYDGPRFHDAHHETGDGNYAGMLALWDRWCGTSSPGYDPRLGRLTGSTSAS